MLSQAQKAGRERKGRRKSGGGRAEEEGEERKRGEQLTQTDKTTRVGTNLVGPRGWFVEEEGNEDNC